MNSVKARTKNSRVPMAIGAGVAGALLLAVPTAMSSSGTDTATGADGAVVQASALALAHTDKIGVSEAISESSGALKEQYRKNAKAKAAKAAKGKAKTSAKPAASSGSKVMPTSNFELTARFGQAGGWSRGYHTGLDFAGPTGTPIVASMGGEVIQAGYEGAFGNKVTVKHADGTQASYSHLNSISASAGQSVSAGTQLGTLGNTGNSTGPHLHMEVSQGDGWAGGTFVDPWNWLHS